MRKVAYLTLGCDKNRVDAERTLGSAAAAGFEVVESPEPAWALVVNTCGFIDAAKEESVEAVMEAVRAKERGEYEVVAVVGCLVQRYRDELAAEVPEVDLWMGLEHVDQLAAALAKLDQQTKPSSPLDEQNGMGERREPRSSVITFNNSSRLLTTPSHYSFLKIADGCDSVCRYCAIPRIRGRFRSAPLARLVEEARMLEAAGVRELNLVAQDTTAYGHDLNPRRDLADLIERLLAETAIPWLRVLYGHPAHLSDRVIGLLASEERLCGYLDLPLQHISDKMLSAMGRKPDRAGTMALLDRLAGKAPELWLRTTFLVGYPGETDRDFGELVELVEAGRFMWSSGFAFSPQEGTAAERLSGRVEAAVAEDRLGALFDAQREVTAGRLAELVGREVTLLVDGPWEEYVEGPDGGLSVAPADGAPRWLARLPGQAVEVDGVVQLEAETNAGALVWAKITESWDYDVSAKEIK